MIVEDPIRVDLSPLGERPDGLSATEVAYRYLKERILDLRIPPRAAITEKQIGEATGLSRTPIREALLRLRGDRLVTIIPRGGAVVAEITARQIRELAETRLLIESHAVEVICRERIEVGDRLLRIVDAQQEMLLLDPAEIDLGEVIRLDRQFHAAIVGAPGNTLLSTLYDAVGDHQQRTGVLAFTVAPSRRLEAPDLHRTIAGALAAFDMEAAMSAITEHLSEGDTPYERFLRN